MVSFYLDPRLSRRLDASDIVQDVQIEAIRKLPAYLADPRVSFYPWLRRLAWQRLIDSYRAHVLADRRSVKRERECDLPLPDTTNSYLAKVLVAQQSSPSEQMSRKERCSHVRQALDELRSGDRQVLVQRYVEQLTFLEIAEVMESSEAAAKMRHLRALQRLGQVLRQS